MLYVGGKAIGVLKAKPSPKAASSLCYGGRIRCAGEKMQVRALT